MPDRVLGQILGGPALLGLEQAGIVILLALAVMLIARWQAIHLERETLVAVVRGLVQIVAVGLILVPLLAQPFLYAVPVLAAMIAAAAFTAARRARGLRGGLAASFVGIAFGAGVVILFALLTGVMEPTVNALIAVGSMVIANAMNTSAQALERFRSDVAAHTAEIETALALGADPGRTVMPYVRNAVGASLIPRLDTLRALGIVWIPGLMAGMILSGSDPVYAAIYQFVVIVLIYAAAGLTALATTLLIRPHAFSAAGQLVLRPEPGAA